MHAAECHFSELASRLARIKRTLADTSQQGWEHKMRETIADFARAINKQVTRPPQNRKRKREQPTIGNKANKILKKKRLAKRRKTTHTRPALTTTTTTTPTITKSMPKRIAKRRRDTPTKAKLVMKQQRLKKTQTTNTNKITSWYAFIEEMTVEMLQEECAKRGLKKSGTKIEVKSRLHNWEARQRYLKQQRPKDPKELRKWMTRQRTFRLFVVCMRKLRYLLCPKSNDQ